VEGWRDAGAALSAQRRHELRTLTAERARSASEALLSLASPTQLAPHRRSSSGLVEQQSLFHRRG
jgi:hypothetical protein